MIEMDQKEQILHYHRVDGLSLREISRRVGLNRKTVTRYIREYEDSIREDPEEGLDLCLASKPKYPKRNIECTRMTEPVCAEIEYWLLENAKRRQTGMRKQCLKKQDTKEGQATDRAYRIGQTKDVYVYYPMAVSPKFPAFDVTLDELLSRKSHLATSTIYPTEKTEVRVDELGGRLFQNVR